MNEINMNEDDYQELFGEFEDSKNDIKRNFGFTSRGEGPFRDRYRPFTLNEMAPTCDINLIKKLIQEPASRVFLLEGNTGTGKTTCAKILGKSFVCLNEQEKPCLSCEPCQRFNKSFDVMEMDSARNRGIDTIRDLIENKFPYRPQEFSKNIYILNEVQGLTPEAQQALLDALEELRPHIIFIMTTSELSSINKALVDRATLLSFNKLSATIAGQVIDEICDLENFEIKDLEIKKSLFNACDGSVRSLLNKIEMHINGGEIVSWIDEQENTVLTSKIFKSILNCEWNSLRNHLRNFHLKREPEAVRIGLENLFRATIINSTNFGDAVKAGKALSCIIGELNDRANISKYNHLVLKCLRAITNIKKV